MPAWAGAAGHPDTAWVLVEPPYLILYRVLLHLVQDCSCLHGARHIDNVLFGEGLE
jgi:hypothetical protein